MFVITRSLLYPSLLESCFTVQTFITNNLMIWDFDNVIKLNGFHCDIFHKMIIVVCNNNYNLYNNLLNVITGQVINGLCDHMAIVPK